MSDDDKTLPGVDSDSWCTPRWLCDALGYFDLDPCSNARSHVNAEVRYDLTRGQDGLKLEWYGSTFVNPPYSDPLPWSQKLARYGSPWVTLVKLDPSTKWWAALMPAASGWAAFNHRIGFDRPDKPPITANFPSALVWSLWKPSAALAPHLWLQTYSPPVPQISKGLRT